MSDPNNAVRQALADIRSTDGWLKRVLLLTAMRSLPILNFFELGYALQWGASAWRNGARAMPKQAFDKDAFLTGLFYCLLTWLLQIGTVWLAVCNVIPIAGTVLWIILLLQAFVFLQIAALRMALFKRFGAAFDMSEIFKKLRLKRTGLYKAALVPMTISTIIIVAMFLVVLIISLLMGLALNAGSAAAGSDANLMALFAVSFSRAMWFYAVIMVLVSIVSLFVLVLGEVWTFRAVGYWCDYYAFDWICEADLEKEAKR